MPALVRPAAQADSRRDPAKTSCQRIQTYKKTGILRKLKTAIV
jgi:hypothetical protein